MLLLSCFDGLRRQRSGPQDRSGQSRRALHQNQLIQFPLHFAGPVAVLEPGFRLGRYMREFDPADVAEIESFAPGAMVVPLRAALSLADRKICGRITLPTLQFALVVLTRAHDEALNLHHRDLLWRAFGVPVFEQLRGANGAVIARECEVHDGLHVPDPEAIGDLTCEVVTGHCECGAETPRLRNLSPCRQMAAAAAA